MLTVTHKRLDFFKNYPKADWFTVCFQNVRSLKLHSKDIVQDSIMMSSDAVCLAETSLDSNVWPDQDHYEEFTIFSKNRKDSFENEERRSRKSGGVALLIKNHLVRGKPNPDCIVSNLEMVSCVIKLDILNEVNCEILLIVIYKDHQAEETNMLHELLDKLQVIFQRINNRRGEKNIE